MVFCLNRLVLTVKISEPKKEKGLKSYHDLRCKMKKSRMRRIRILGAGVSGLTAAINLAKEGYDVEVYERGKEVGTRFRGDLQGLDNWSDKRDIPEMLKSFGLDMNFDCDPFRRVEATNTKVSKGISRERPLFYLVKRGPFRGSLDYGLKEQALKSGVKIFFGRSIAEADIVATGTMPEYVPGIVKGCVFKTNLEDQAVLAFSDDLAYKGYSYLLVTHGYGCLCTVVLNDLTRAEECFKRVKDYFESRFGLDLTTAKPVGGVGSFSLSHCFKKGKTLYVGEAAGLQDVFMGFGMKMAMRSGYLAARSIIEGFDYAKAAKKSLEKYMKASIVNRYIFEKISRRGNYSLFMANTWLFKKLLYSSSNYSALQRLIYPLALSYMKAEYPNLWH